MNIAKQLLTENSRESWNKVINYVGKNPQRFDEFMQLFLGDDELLVKRTGQPFGAIVEKQHHLITPYFQAIIDNMSRYPIPSVKRNVMRVLQFVDIPEEYDAQLLELGFNFLQSSEEPIAVKAFTMTVLRKICERYPELTNELIHVIEVIVNENISVGVTNRGKKELVKLEKIKEKNC